jgi:hypothetical protein
MEQRLYPWDKNRTLTGQQRSGLSIAVKSTISNFFTSHPDERSFSLN